jgi:hypothetical protein
MQTALLTELGESGRIYFHTMVFFQGWNLRIGFIADFSEDGVKGNEK